MLVWSCSLANISISARINTAPAGSSGFFYSLFGVVSDEIWGMIKTTVPYHLPGYKERLEQFGVVSDEIWGMIRASGRITSRKMGTTSRRRSQSVGNNDKQRFRITEQCVQDCQKTSDMCYRREHVAQMC
jgi:hypothetical protein